MFILPYCKSIHVFNPLPYRPRAHCAVLPCKHFWLPTSAMLHCSCRAFTRVLFPENMEKEQQTTLRCHVTLHPLYILSEVASQGALRKKKSVCSLKGRGRLRRQIKMRLGKCTFQAEEFPLKACHGRLCACVIFKIGNDMVTAAHRVMHSICSYSETWSFGLWSEKNDWIFVNTSTRKKSVSFR